MAERLKASALKWALAFALALAASLFAATAAFASPNVNVTFPVTTTDSDNNTTTTSQTVNVDLANVEKNTTVMPVAGMYYKGGTWNAIVTGTAANQYWTVDKVLSKAVDQYNTAKSANVKVSDFWYSGTVNKITFTTNDDDNGTSTYTKYYPTYADTNTRQYFYNLAGSGDTTLSSSLMSTSLPLYSTTITLKNPNGVGGVLAAEYATSSVGATAGDAAVYAADALVNHTSTDADGDGKADIVYAAPTHPRFITGCGDGMTSTDAMGKRYCYDITGITIG